MGTIDMDTGTQWREISARADILLQAILDSTPKDGFQVSSPPLRFVVSMYWRTRRLYEATLTLLKARMAEESLIVARSLFEESLRLRQIAEEVQGRDALILRWVNASIEEKKGLLEVGKARGLYSDIQTGMSFLEEESRKLQQYARQNGVQSFKPFLDVKEAASRYGRKEDYWTYEWAHEIVHGSDAAWMFARRQIGDGSLFFNAKTEDDSLLSSIAHFAAVSFADAASATFKILSWALPSRFDEIVRDIERLLDQTDKLENKKG